MRKRLTFKCWHCHRPYSLLRDLEGSPKLAVECPYCGKAAVADLDPYRDQTVEVFKGDSAIETPTGATLNLPDVIPTAQPED
jgi:DNA-directed RNA polymerase subunit RPC12/RpoP